MAAWFLARPVVGYAILATLLAVIALGLNQCNRNRAATAKVEAAQGEARAESGRVAVDTVAGRAADEAAIDQLSRENEHAIRNAPGADQPLDPALNRAGRSSLCLRAAYRNRPECRVLKPDPGDVAHAR